MKNKTILLVEDESDVSITIKNLLLSEGFKVITAIDGMEALSKVESLPVDLIVLDIMIPKLDGYKVCRLLKFDDRYKKIPIIIITACAQESDIEQGMKCGADGFITKPFDFKVLMEKIGELLKDRVKGQGAG